jgi:hypothetical protein
MTKDLDTVAAAIDVRPLDDAYASWFSAESESELALRAWLHCSDPSRLITYAVYRAALDREEAAARDLERLWSLAKGCRTRIAVGGQAL